MKGCGGMVQIKNDPINKIFQAFHKEYPNAEKQIKEIKLSSFKGNCCKLLKAQDSMTYRILVNILDDKGHQVSHMILADNLAYALALVAGDVNAYDNLLKKSGLLGN